MREVKVLVKLYDDLDYAQDKTKNEAAHTVTVGLNGVWRELDLSEARHAELEKMIRPYLDAGRVPDEAPKPNDPMRAKRGSPEFAYMEGMRKFAQENGIKYRGKTGKYYYQKKLREAYAEYLEQQGEMAL